LNFVYGKLQFAANLFFSPFVLIDMARLRMVQRLAVLAAFQAAVAAAYFSVIERSRTREGSFSKDGYDFWDMYGKPKHMRKQEAAAVIDEKKA
jgi:hypothetical protein